MTFSPTIILADGEEANGLASMLAELVRQNLEQKPERLPDFQALHGRVGIVAQDIELSLTMAFSSGALIVHNGLQPPLHLTVMADSDSILDMSRLPLRYGLPDFASELGKSIFQRMRARRIAIRGMLRHFPMLVRLTRVLSVA